MLFSIEASQRLCRDDPRLVETHLQLTFWNVLPASCRFSAFLGSRSCLLKRPFSQVWLEASSDMSPISRELFCVCVYIFALFPWSYPQYNPVSELWGNSLDVMACEQPWFKWSHHWFVGSIPPLDSTFQCVLEWVTEPLNSFCVSCGWIYTYGYK